MMLINFVIIVAFVYLMYRGVKAMIRDKLSTNERDELRRLRAEASRLTAENERLCSENILLKKKLGTGYTQPTKDGGILIPHPRNH